MLGQTTSAGAVGSRRRVTNSSSTPSSDSFQFCASAARPSETAARGKTRRPPKAELTPLQSNKTSDYKENVLSPINRLRNHSAPARHGFAAPPPVLVDELLPNDIVRCCPDWWN
ncbi:hypothetical protein EVAR_40384_1 [Eumeta japonica]|uniref:Uncharacterized protein n=1 Tax=Eumeta variegata TaxID=151549 RepID=A0A4C1WAQ5_EUMVA|nr:hypothetical protein EVAR_40384_1 [Eumeta japonica]